MRADDAARVLRVIKLRGLALARSAETARGAHEVALAAEARAAQALRERRDEIAATRADLALRPACTTQQFRLAARHAAVDSASETLEECAEEQIAAHDERVETAQALARHDARQDAVAARLALLRRTARLRQELRLDDEQLRGQRR